MFVIKYPCPSVQDSHYFNNDVVWKCISKHEANYDYSVYFMCILVCISCDGDTSIKFLIAFQKFLEVKFCNNQFFSQAQISQPLLQCFIWWWSFYLCILSSKCIWKFCCFFINTVWEWLFMSILSIRRISRGKQ